MKKSLLILMPMLMFFGLPAHAQTKLAAGTQWSESLFTRIDASFSSNDFHARWDISRCECGDIHILAEETLPGEIRKGEQLLLDSKVLLINGYKNFEGPLAALLDSPMLIMQLLFVLLNESEPSGPAAVIKTFNADVNEKTDALMLDSRTAFGAFPAPWSLSGTIKPSSPGQYVYHLRFTFNLQEAGVQWIQMSGLLDYSDRTFPLDDNTVLDGWSAAWLDLKTENHEGLTPGITLGKFRESL